MNQRIEKLAEQAGIWKPTHDHKTWVKGEYISSPRELEKFAELIVQECTDLVQKYMTRWPEDCELTKQIKEHFGVDK